ncbi:MAG: hypothetical protein UD936_11215 [Acutalibacteraceae bacterium]|nr:hypothetical protein [Acutalibacteraceae bacterium]
MNSSKINIKCIVILSAIILLLCIICAMLTLDNHNKGNTQSNHTTDTNTQTEQTTEVTNKQTEVSDSIVATSFSTSPPATVPTESKPAKQESTHTPFTEAPATPATSSATANTENHFAEQATAITEPTTNDNELLEQVIAHSGYTLKDISNIKSEQLIVVTGYNSDSGTTARLFSFNNNQWQKEKLDCRVTVGSNGIATKTNDDDNITPKGLYTIGDAFYIDKKPSTWLNTFKITSNTYWVINAESDMYNKKIELEGNNESDKAIHMISSPSYRYGCVVNYNTDPIIKGKGSAIFLECGDSATNGSIAFSENDLLKYLEILNSEKKPAIIIF